MSGSGALDDIGNGAGVFRDEETFFVYGSCSSNTLSSSILRTFSSLESSPQFGLPSTVGGSVQPRTIPEKYSLRVAQ